MIKIFFRVFTRSLYIMIAAVSAGVMFLLVSALSNIDLLVSVLKDTLTPINQKLNFFYLLLINGLALRLDQIGILVAATLLFGVNTALLAYYFREYVLVSTKGIVASVGALVTAVLGLGCFACGSVVLTFILSSIGISAPILLPFDTQWFSALGVVGLLAVCIYLLRKLSRPFVCNVE